MDVNALMQLLGMGGAARANPLEHMAMAGQPPAGGNEVMAALERAKRLEEVRRQLEQQRMMREGTTGAQTGANTDMQMMQALQGMLGGGGGIMPQFSMGGSSRWGSSPSQSPSRY